MKRFVAAILAIVFQLFWVSFALASGDPSSSQEKGPGAVLTRPPGDLLPPRGMGLTAGQLRVPAGLRLLVFSPHPDDETLASGGLIQRVLELKGHVRVVFITNGDGFADGVRLRYHHAGASSSEYVEYGKQRHDEAVEAMRDLGLKTSDGLFLGFPDAGIDKLWEHFWSDKRLYTSPYTLFDHPGYASSLSRSVGYSGTGLDDEIERIIEDYAPDWVVLPDPRDRHPDHAATGVFVLDALRRLNNEGKLTLARVQAFTYLVHYVDYPVSELWVGQISQSGVNGTSTGARVLATAQWVSISLPPQEVARKRLAVEAYRTQLLVIGRFMRAFIRPNELFAHLDFSQVMDIPQEYTRDREGLGNSEPK